MRSFDVCGVHDKQTRRKTVCRYRQLCGLRRHAAGNRNYKKRQRACLRWQNAVKTVGRNPRVRVCRLAGARRTDLRRRIACCYGKHGVYGGLLVAETHVYRYFQCAWQSYKGNSYGRRGTCVRRRDDDRIRRQNIQNRRLGQTICGNLCRYDLFGETANHGRRGRDDRQRNICGGK